MYHLTKNNAVLPRDREKLFAELMTSGYHGAPLLKYRAFREREMRQFGREKLKNTDLGKELCALLTALSLRSAAQNRRIFPRVSGEGCFLFPTEWFEHDYCSMLADAISASHGQTVYTDLRIQRTSLRVGIYYAGKQLPEIRAGYMAQRENGVIRICSQMKLTPAAAGGFQDVRMFLCDRLSPVSLVFS